MNPWVLLDRDAVPGGGELRLLRRGDEFVIMLGRDELMNSRRAGSEEALARLGCAPIGSRRGAVVLIGGLGLGFTLRAAQPILAANARIVVAELAPAIVRWARGPLRPIFGESLDDPRVSIHAGDVGDLIKGRKAAYDAILLDVDNGPDGFSRESNDSLYAPRGLAAARDALRPGGALAVWSSGPDKAFVERLRRARFKVEEVGVHAHGMRGPRHVIWIATAPR